MAECQEGLGKRKKRGFPDRKGITVPMKGVQKARQRVGLEKQDTSVLSPAGHSVGGAECHCLSLGPAWPAYLPLQDLGPNYASLQQRRRIFKGSVPIFKIFQNHFPP